MTQLDLTRHASRRSQQRSIPQAALEIVRDFGAVARSRGADSYFFDKESRRQLKAKLGTREFVECERWLNVYAVIADDGSVITCARRTGRFRR